MANHNGGLSIDRGPAYAKVSQIGISAQYSNISVRWSFNAAKERWAITGSSLMPMTLTRITLMACSIGLVACANLNTISRRTSLPPNDDETGLAIHLDAQQRIVSISDSGIICAEPSPDALNALAASLGLGASLPGTGASSLAAGQQSSVASIGLRTQSITLMRDALYRMCEAYANGSVGPAQIATLLGRSQDLTAVILSVEQLTGAVAANQVALTATTRSGASSALLANQELLDAAREHEAESKNKLEEAEAELAESQKKLGEKNTAETGAKLKYDNLIGSDPELKNPATQDAKAAFDQSVKDREAVEEEVEVAESLVQTREEMFENAKSNREIIENLKNQAFADATAATSSSSQFSQPVQRIQLNKEASIAVAKSVENMVTLVLQKEYIAEGCLAILTYLPNEYEFWGPERQYLFDQSHESCLSIVRDTAVRQVELMKLRTPAIE